VEVVREQTLIILAQQELLILELEEVAVDSTVHNLVELAEMGALVL
jgi:hypothetical protein